MRQLSYVVFFILAFAILPTFGQGFSSRAVGEGKIDEALTKCGPLPDQMPTNFYNPGQNSYKKTGTLYIAKKDHWSCMWTGAIFQWKAEPANSHYNKLPDGDMSYEGQSALGITACHNRVLAIFYVEEIVVTPPPVITPTPTPPPPAPSPTPVMCTNIGMSQADARKANLTVSDEGKCVAITPPAPECPTCKQIAVQRVKEGAWNTKQVALSAGIGAVGSILGSNGGLKHRAIYGGISAGASAAANVGARAASPKADKAFTFTTTDLNNKPLVFTLARGESYHENGINIDWRNDHWELTEGNCYGYWTPQDTFILTPIPIFSRTSTTTASNGARKVQTQAPNRGGIAQTGVGNRVPGGDVPISNAPGTTVPTRPRAPGNSFANGATSAASTSTSTLANGQRVTIREH